MKKLIIGLTLLVSMSSFAGNFVISDNNGLGPVVAVGVKHASIDKDNLVLIGTLNYQDGSSEKKVCFISLDVLKDMNIDPVVLGSKLKSGKASPFDGKRITCIKKRGKSTFQYEISSQDDFELYL